jgi:hypothetical protein
MLKTTSFEMSQKLKENGFPQDTLEYEWFKLLHSEGWDIATTKEVESIVEPFHYAAPTIMELLERITNDDFEIYQHVHHIGLWSTLNLVRDPDKLAEIWLWTKNKDKKT